MNSAIEQGPWKNSLSSKQFNLPLRELKFVDKAVLNTHTFFINKLLRVRYTITDREQDACLFSNERQPILISIMLTE